MPPIKAHAEVFRDWEGLIGACEKNAALLPGMEALVTELKDFVGQGKTIKVEQAHQAGLRKAKTQELLQLLDDGKESARQLRAFVLTRFKSRTEQLSQFGITPSRTRKRKVSLPKPQVPEAPLPAQETTAETVTASAPAEETTNPPAATPAAE